MENLCTEIIDHAADKGLTPATVVRYAVGANAQTWAKWRDGKASCSVVTAEKIRAYMRGDAAKYAAPKASA